MAAKKKNTGTEVVRTRSIDHVNAVIVVGEVARDASLAETADGRVFVSFDVVCRTDEGRTVVPVTLEGEMAVNAGETVVVSGAVHKRFFAAGAGLASRTDVRAHKVTVVRRKDQVARALAVHRALLPSG